MAELSAHDCPDCGTELMQDRDAGEFECPLCGNKFKLKEENNAVTVGERLNY